MTEKSIQEIDISWLTTSATFNRVGNSSSVIHVFPFWGSEIPGNRDLVFTTSHSILLHS